MSQKSQTIIMQKLHNFQLYAAIFADRTVLVANEIVKKRTDL